MPFSLRTEPRTGIVVATCMGALSLGDAKNGAMAYWQNPDWSGRPVVWDFRSASLEVTASEVREFAGFILEHQPTTPARVALVVARDVDFGVGRMYEVMRERPATPVAVFRDYDEAVSWAGEGLESTASTPPAS